MKVVLFAGRLGTRISEETEARPKPMVEIGSKPILWHIMKIYSHFGFAGDRQLADYQHKGLRDKLEFEALWQSNQAKWKIWK